MKVINPVVTWPFGGSGISPRTWTVHETDPHADYPTIQAAINASSTGDVILIGAGVYTETLAIASKEVILVGLGSNGVATTSAAVTVEKDFLDADGYLVGITGTGNIIASDIKFAAYNTAVGSSRNTRCIVSSSSMTSTFSRCVIGTTVTGSTSGGTTIVKAIETSSAPIELRDCQVQVSDSAEALGITAIAIDLQAASGSSEIHTSIVNAATATGTPYAIKAAGTAVTIDGGNILAQINRTSGIVTVIGGGKIAGITGDTDNDTEANIAKSAFGLVTTDGQKSIYKSKHRSITADPGSLGDGDVWYRSDLTELRGRANGITHSLIGFDFLGSTALGANATNTSNITIAARDMLVIIVRVVGFSVASVPSLRFNADSGNNYWDRHMTAAIGGVVFTNTQTASTNQMRISRVSQTTSSSYWITITNRSATSKVAAVTGQSGSGAAATISTVGFGGGEWVNTSAQITQVQLRAVANNLLAGTGFAVFGKNL